MSEYIEIDILKDEECFVCFDNSQSLSPYIRLKCCNRNNIHKLCLFNIFINYLNLNQSKIACPLCRQEISIQDYFTLDESITLYSMNDEICKRKLLTKFNSIITFNFIDGNNQLQIDEATSTITVVNKPCYKTYGFTIVLFIILVLCVIGFRFI